MSSRNVISAIKPHGNERHEERPVIALFRTDMRTENFPPATRCSVDNRVCYIPLCAYCVQLAYRTLNEEQV